MATQRAGLYGVLALADFTVNVAPGPFPGLFIPIPHPAPGSDIAISTVITRIHLIKYMAGDTYSTVLFLVRASDFSLLGGCATDVKITNSNNIQFDALADREFQHKPQSYKLAAGDSLLAVYRTFGSILHSKAEFEAKLDILYNFQFISPKGYPL